MASRQYCTFRLGDHLLGVEVPKVQEVLRYQQMTSVPLAQPEISGLINLRGQIMTALDMRVRLGLPPREEGRPMNVVLKRDEDGVSLLVDGIGDVVEVEESGLELPPESLEPRVRELVTGVFKLERRLLLILDTEKVVAVEPIEAA